MWAREPSSALCPHSEAGDSGHRCPLIKQSMSKAILVAVDLLCPVPVILPPLPDIGRSGNCVKPVPARERVAIWSCPTGDMTASAASCAVGFRQIDMNSANQAPARLPRQCSRSAVLGSGLSFQLPLGLGLPFWTGVGTCSPLPSPALSIARPDPPSDPRSSPWPHHRSFGCSCVVRGRVELNRLGSMRRPAKSALPPSDVSAIAEFPPTAGR